ncbi:exosome complex component RRP4, partial [Tanacetum coccineum]
MRGGMELMLSLNQTQKIRLQRALESLESGANSNASVTVADTIPVNQEDGVLKYKPEVGDIIVGRVLEVAQKRWRLEINFSQDATLMLSSMNLPDGIQRRRTAVDELNMRSIFEEDDVICAEVRDFMRDGSLQLQARSQKYGKLEKGQMLTISPYLVKRRKQHFHHLEQYGIDLILGCNGFIWVGEHVETTDNMIEDEPTKPESQDITSMSLEEQEQTYTPLETRQNICRIANAIRVLSTLGFSITIDVILEIVDLSTSKGLDIHDMLGAEFCVLVAEKEAERRNLKTRRKRALWNYFLPLQLANFISKFPVTSHEVWLSDPTQIRPSAQVVWPIVSQDILNASQISSGIVGCPFMVGQGHKNGVAFAPNTSLWSGLTPPTWCGTSYQSGFGSPVAVPSVFMPDNHKGDSFASNHLATSTWKSTGTSSRPSYAPTTFVGPVSTSGGYRATSNVEKLVSISAMPAYNTKSHEELRLEDYMTGKRGSGTNSSEVKSYKIPFPKITSPSVIIPCARDPIYTDNNANPFAPKTSLTSPAST